MMSPHTAAAIAEAVLQADVLLAALQRVVLSSGMRYVNGPGDGIGALGDIAVEAGELPADIVVVDNTGAGDDAEVPNDGDVVGEVEAAEDAVGPMAVVTMPGDAGFIGQGLRSDVVVSDDVQDDVQDLGETGVVDASSIPGDSFAFGDVVSWPVNGRVSRLLSS